MRTWFWLHLLGRRSVVEMILLYIFLLYVFSSSINCDQEAEQDANRKRIIEQLTRTRTVILDDYHLVTRQIATDVFMFRSYRTVSVVFYPVMRDVTEARFTFQSEDLHLNNIGRFYTFFFISWIFSQITKYLKYKIFFVFISNTLPSFWHSWVKMWRWLVLLYVSNIWLQYLGFWFYYHLHL